MEEASLCSSPWSGCPRGQQVPALVQFGCMSAQFLLVWVSLSWTSSHWNQVSYLNKHTNIVLKERKLGEAYLFRIILFYLLKGKCWTLPCPHLILPTVELARDVGACPPPQVTHLALTSPQLWEESGCVPWCCGSMGPSPGLLFMLSPCSWVSQLNRKDGLL